MVIKAWIVPQGSTAGHAGLSLVERAQGTPGHGEVRIRVRACSLNYRDQIVASGRLHYGPAPRDTVPLSDGAGEVLEVGAGVHQFRAGDRIVSCFFQDWTAGRLRSGVHASALGGALDGMLAEEVILRAEGMLPIPAYMSFEEAATLPCAALTAWNALFEIAGIRPGETVLTQGTGGVSVFAIQMAVAAGARVIATSSSDAKLARARELGAHHTINYRQTPDWAQEALRLTDGEGVDAVIEVGGPGTLPRSLKAVRMGGTVALIGLLSEPGQQIDPLPLVGKGTRLQGVYVGSRSMFEDMNRWLALQQIHPVIDRVIPFECAPEAYAHQASGSHFGKVVIANA